MNKLTEPPVPVDMELRRLAATAIAAGQTPAELRRTSAGTPHEPQCKQLADEIEYLTARGMTPAAARRVTRRLDRVKLEAPVTPETVRQVARIFINEGMTPNGLRDRTTTRDTFETRCMFAAIAGAMDEMAVRAGAPASSAQPSGSDPAGGDDDPDAYCMACGARLGVWCSEWQHWRIPAGGRIEFYEAGHCPAPAWRERKPASSTCETGGTRYEMAGGAR